jgi:osmotically-inducible protein OsmY
MTRIGTPWIVLVAALASIGCGNARPYRAMAKAASSEESAPAQAQDHRLKMQLREAIAGEDPRQLADVTPYVYMGHAYLVGFVPKHGDADALVDRARAVEGVRSVDTYLPAKPDERSLVSDEEIKAKVKSALALEPGQVVTRIEIEVLARHVVLLGVVRSAETVADAERLASSVDGVSGVTNFLLVPEEEYRSRRPKLRDRLMED